MTTAKVKEWFIENGKRVLKVLQFGAKTSHVAAPYGDDSNPLKGMTAILAETSVSGEVYVLGYVNTHQIAEEGEKRIFSQKLDGKIATYIWLKNDETIEIGGNDYTAVRFAPLKTGIDGKDIKINAELGKIATAIGLLGGAYVPGNITTDLENAESEKIKLQ